MLSLHTNNAALSAQNTLARTQSTLSTSMTRLSTGFRINSAMDDAAGLQIATRLKSQSSGMAVAMRNTQNSTSMMQTAEGALGEVSNILIKMKDLATQAADGSSTVQDQGAMQSEFDTLTSELSNIVSNTTFGGTKLLNSTAGTTGGKLNAAINLQIGSAKSETMAVDLSTELTNLDTTLETVSTSYDGATGAPVATLGTEISDTTDATIGSTAANTTIGNLDAAIESVSTARSKIGAVTNRLDHIYSNLSNVSTNTKAAAGRIMDTDFATESASMTSNQMLLQAGTAMLKQSNSMSSLVMSLLQ